MKLLVFTIIFGLFCHGTMAWVGIILRNDTERASHKIPDNRCFSLYQDIGELGFGERKKLSESCAIATCQPNLDLALEGCSTVAVDGECQILDGDINDPFPDCCYKIVCKESILNKI
ncbi:uncharacterized protein LOC115885440 [Sitophilus oryzae]|uniref:Uncharacterized protein LOC115885440 n=1 Tax=Sitophilus oryzae TaxID=7048 RepID=A0A6J2Y9Q9_SITOR|nr:uncharacterized protein LOC115885440 [Sitophilus oryzae]